MGTISGRDFKMQMQKHKYPIKNPCTGEWWFNGKWYDYYPSEEVENHNSWVDECLERKLNERKERDE